MSIYVKCEVDAASRVQLRFLVREKDVIDIPRHRLKYQVGVLLKKILNYY